MGGFNTADRLGGTSHLVQNENIFALEGRENLFFNIVKSKKSVKNFLVLRQGVCFVRVLWSIRKAI